MEECLTNGVAAFVFPNISIFFQQIQDTTRVYVVEEVSPSVVIAIIIVVVIVIIVVATTPSTDNEA